MRIRRLWKAAWLLLRNMALYSAAFSEPARNTTAQGTEYDLYEPRGKPYRTVLLVYGMTIAGEKEKRLTKFARALAASGFRTVIPSLPGLKAYTFDSRDLERLADLIIELGEGNEHRLGIIAFSAGASISLAVASRHELTDLVEIFLLFSPYASLQNAWDRLQSLAFVEPDNDAEWDHFIWCKGVLAYIQQEQIGLGIQERYKLERLLADYCTSITSEEKRKFYFEVLRERHIKRDVLVGLDPQIWDAFSPQGKLASLRGRVMILHDPQDPWAPPQDSESIVAELSQRGQPDGQRLLVTPLISHVTPRYLLRVPDLLQVVSIVSEFYP